MEVQSLPRNGFIAFLSANTGTQSTVYLRISPVLNSSASGRWSLKLYRTSDVAWTVGIFNRPEMHLLNGPARYSLDSEDHQVSSATFGQSLLFIGFSKTECLADTFKCLVAVWSEYRPSSALSASSNWNLAAPWTKKAPLTYLSRPTHCWQLGMYYKTFHVWYWTRNDVIPVNMSPLFRYPEK